MDNALATVKSIVAAYGLEVLGAILILLVGRWVVGLLVGMLRRAMQRAEVDATLIGFAVNIAYVAGFAFVILAALSRLGIQTTSFIAVLGAAGLAIALSLQGSLGNFAAGTMMIVFRPFKAGDYVEAGGTAGTVDEIMIFSTKLRTPDNRLVYVPNGTIMNDVIVNYSANDTRRLDLVFGCSYDDDIRGVKRLLTEIVESDERVLSEPAPVVVVLELADHSVNFAVRPWVAASDYWPLHFDLTERVKLRFDESGFSIPYPQRDVHLHQQAA